jgi:putative pyruvate formate lyase activating enzyme
MWRLTRPDSLNILDDPGVVRAMPRYVDVVRERRLAKFVNARNIAVEFKSTAPTEDLWELHSAVLEEYEEVERRVDAGSRLQELESGTSFLDLKVELGRRIMTGCHFCERRCGVDRLAGGLGYCGCGANFSVSSYFPHLGEEPELVPSGTIFTCGCSIRCLHCQNWSISQWGERGQEAEPGQLARVVESLRRQGCRNINMVGGDPTPNCWLWLRTMREVEPNVVTVWNSNSYHKRIPNTVNNIPTVWNSNSYYSEETAKLLAGFIDLYLLDFKYGNNKCAEEISDAPGYWEACTRNHLVAKEYGELVIRVLVLPEHNECCTRPILSWIANCLGPWTRVNLMFQYRPEWRARERKELGRRLNRREIEEAKQIAKEVGLRNLVRG